MAAAADFHDLRIARAEHVAGNALVLTFDVPRALDETFAFKPGQHIALRTMLDGQEVRRNYSICAGPGSPLRVAIKRVDGGQFSSWAHASLREGATIAVQPPSGRFVLSPAKAASRHILLFAAGSGITPCLGITRQALEQESMTRVTLVYGNRGRETTMFAAELEALKDRFLGRLVVMHVLSRPGEADIELLSGRITGEKVRRFGKTLIDYKSAERIFVCGPGGMIKEVRDALLDLGLARDVVQHEFFAPPGSAPRAGSSPPKAATSKTPESAGVDAVAILEGTRYGIKIAPGETVLDAALRAGLKPPYSCTGGMCATCRARLVEGAADMRENFSLETWEIERGFTLTCQAVPRPGSGVLVVDWDAM